MVEQTEYLLRLREATYQTAPTVVRIRDDRTDRVLSGANGRHLSESINSSENKTWQNRKST